MPVLAAPDPSPDRPLPGPFPWPIPAPPPEPPRPDFAFPEGDIAKEPGVALPGVPRADPGALETITPFPAPVPPAGEGGARTEPASSGPPSPPPRVPLPCPEVRSPRPTLGGGGTTSPGPRLPEVPRAWLRFRLPASEPKLGGGGTTLSAERTVPRPPAVWLWPWPPPVREEPALTLGGGGTIWVAAVMPTMARGSCERPPSCTGGGTTFGSDRLAPVTVRSLVTCEGGGAITAGAGMFSFAA